MPLNFDDLAILQMYIGTSPNREKTIQVMAESIPLVEDSAIQLSMSELIDKISAMSDEAFLCIDFSDLPQ